MAQKQKAKVMSVPEFCRKMVEKGVCRPTEIKREYENAYPNVAPKSPDCYQKALNRQGFTKDIRDKKALEINHVEGKKNILASDEIRKFLQNARLHNVTEEQKNRQLDSIVTVSELMNGTDPHTWTYEDIVKDGQVVQLGVINAIAQKYPFFINEKGVETFAHKGAVRLLLTSINTLFPNILPKGWYSGFARAAGELKDFFTKDEFDLFISNLADSTELSVEGWRAMYKTQVNLGCREGQNGLNGITGLQWQDINYSLKRCSLHEKGGRGQAGRVWQNLPLDLFPWLNSFEDLMIYHEKKFGYRPTNDRHESGNVFGVSYRAYIAQFHYTRKKCSGRIAGTKETFKPHILRKTHAQWEVSYLWLPLQDICGQFPNGRYGVGWDNPQILLKYYVTLDAEAQEKADKQAHERMIKLGFVKGEIEEDPKDARIRELTETVNKLSTQITELLGRRQ